MSDPNEHAYITNIFSCETGYALSCTTVVVRIGTRGTVLYVY